jgi:hypothetical protein
MLKNTAPRFMKRADSICYSYQRTASDNGKIDCDIQPAKMEIQWGYPRRQGRTANDGPFMIGQRQNRTRKVSANPMATVFQPHDSKASIGPVMVAVALSLFADAAHTNSNFIPPRTVDNPGNKPNQPISIDIYTNISTTSKNIYRLKSRAERRHQLTCYPD